MVATSMRGWVQIPTKRGMPSVSITISPPGPARTVTADEEGAAVAAAKSAHRVVAGDDHAGNPAHGRGQILSIEVLDLMRRPTVVTRLPKESTVELSTMGEASTVMAP